MGSNQSPLKKLINHLKPPNEENKDDYKSPKKTKWLLIAGLVGIAFMLISNMWTEKNLSTPAVKQETEQIDVETFGAKKEQKPKSIKDYETKYENQLKEALDEIVGVNDVTVIVNVEATEKKILEKNTTTQKQVTKETDKQGGEREIEDQTKEEQLVIIRKGEKESPIVLETRNPEIRGVLVVATGVDNIQVKKWVIEAVTRVLDVPSHRVAVMPKKTKGE
ncbi:stage III sporulation protein AG [Oikeobacillus pervagus]|uniref:Stage III sporulation protein AG n=1 Tax=Oikeobacillus pervagus TaxID=1325931 RepID=A0AAJ1T2T5_9BACI|nr:stage III sporulation protein AG [Oikeobacillus pervagus]MDQ0213830.1 stage III sporulation protein AG [Oikeobacillus pervagus]